MRYYKIVEDGYITGIGKGSCGEEITAEEYESLMTIIRNRPTADTGFDYKLKEDLTWELYECPVIERDNEEISDSEALNIIVGGADV